MKQIGKNYVLNTKSSYIVVLGLLLFTSCQYFRHDVSKTPIAKVYENILYLEDVNPDIYKAKKPGDSLINIQNFIEQWAYKTLLITQAKKNLDTVAINNLVKQYKQDLLIDTYKDLLAEKYLDTVVTDYQIQQSFETNKDYFIARNHLIDVSYLVIDKNHSRKNDFKKWFFSEKLVYRDSLIKNIVYFKKYNFNSPYWLQLSKFKSQLPVFKHINDRQILKKSKKFVLTDSLSLYLVLVNNYVKENEALPLDFIKTDLKQLILNRRKQQVMIALQNEIKTEAIKQKKFKIYKIEKNDE